MYLLDTNVISELRKVGDGKADENVVACLSQMDAALIFVSSIVLMEIELGIRLLERRDGAQGARLRHWIDNHILPEFAERTLPIDAPVALCCARLHVPNPRPARDAYIAATALVHEMTVVTRNVRDFEPMGVRTIDPWRAAD